MFRRAMKQELTMPINKAPRYVEVNVIVLTHNALGHACHEKLHELFIKIICSETQSSTFFLSLRTTLTKTHRTGTAITSNIHFVISFPHVSDLR